MAKRAPEPALPASPSPLVRAFPLVVFVVSFLAFAPALSQGFAPLDDDYNFYYHANWAGLSGAHVEWMFTTSHLGHWQPLSWFSLALDYARTGCPPLPPGTPYAAKALLDQHEVAQAMHQTNLVLHALGAVFLYFALRRLLALAFETDRREPVIATAAWLGALLHAVHPLRVESVAWATERRDVLSGMFLCGSLAAWLVARDGGGFKWTALSVLAFALSLASKAWGMTFPVVLLLLEIYPLRQLRPGSNVGVGPVLRRLAPYFVLAIVGAGAAAWAQGESAAIVKWEEHGPLQRCAQAAWGLVFYVGKTLWPVDLSPMYLLERELDPARPPYLVSFALVAVAGGACVWLWSRKPGIVIALALYALVVSPVLGFLQSGAQKTADRYTYLAAMPFAALAAAALVWLARRRAALVWLGALPVPVLFALSWQQTKIWGDPIVLWQRVVTVEPDNYFGQHNLAAQFQLRAIASRDPAERSDLLRRAIEHDELSIAAHPVRGNEPARHNLGVLYNLTGAPERAEAAWRDCVKAVPDFVPCLEELRRVLLARGDREGLKRLFDDALAALPPNLPARKLYAETLAQLGDRQNAERVWREGLAADRSWAAGWYGLGELLLQQEKLPEAEDALRAALAADGRLVDAWVALGRVLRAARRVEDAEACWRNALMLAPNHPVATSLLQKSRAERPARN